LITCVHLSGIPQNKTEAVRLYRDAAAKGVSAAVERLKVLHQHQPSNKGQNIFSVKINRPPGDVLQYTFCLLFRTPEQPCVCG